MWRKTPQTTLIRKLLAEKGHATNQELAKEARKEFPHISNTTVHRITSRLVAAGMARNAPSLNRVSVIDANPEEHHHFLCQECHKLVDIKLPKEMLDKLQKQLPSKLARHDILIAGICEKCDC